MSSLLFCLGLRRGLRRFENQCVHGSIHLEYIDDVVLQFQPHLAHEVIPAFEGALKSVNLFLNHSKCKALIPSVLEEEGKHPSLVDVGLVQVFGSMDLLGGAMDGDFVTPVGGLVHDLPKASLKRMAEAEALGASIEKLLLTPLSRSSHRAAWSLIDKVLNKALDYDARILHPELFSTIASRLDHVVRKTLLRVIQVDDLKPEEEQSIRLGVLLGGCGITSAQVKGIFAHFAAACQYFPLVGQTLLDMGWNRQEIEEAIDFSGVEHCISQLRGYGICVRVDGKISLEVIHGETR